ncbi:MAG: hypothetical protein AB8B61_06985 [Cyclobacteriaceae bacterium]
MKVTSVLSILIAAFLVSCSSNQSEKSSGNHDDLGHGFTIENEEELVSKINLLVLNNLTTPISVIEKLNKEEKVYHPEYANSLENVNTYDTKFSQALNYGGYGLDLMYRVAHGHFIDVVQYKDKTLPLAKSIGLDSFYDQTDLQKFVDIAGNHLSLNQFIMDEYHRIDEYLMSHHNYQAAILTITGCMLEGMYFTGKTIEEKNEVDDVIYKLLVNEKNLLHQVVPLYDYFKDNEKMVSLKKELLKVQEDFDKFTTKESLNMELAHTLDEDIITLRERVVSNQI